MTSKLIPPSVAQMDSLDGVSSQVGTSATPMTAAGGPETPSPAPGGSAVPAPTPPLIRLLLVDDHEDTNRSLMLLLGRRGYKVRTATSLHDAVELARQETFDVLVSDMSLPDGNGLELLGRLREYPPLYGGIVVSGYSDDEDLARSRAAGYREHLSKPVDVRKLDETIRRLLSSPATSP